MTRGQSSDMMTQDDLMAEDVPQPEAMRGDKGHASDVIRSDIEGRGIEPAIRTKSNRKVQRTVDETADAMRNRIEGRVDETAGSL